MLDTALFERVRDAFGGVIPGKLGLAVSGGGDSMALMHLMHELGSTSGSEMHVVTVDHGLRDASVHEANEVAKSAAQLGLPHETLKWRGWDRRGNLQNEARNARYALMADWAQANGIDRIALAHTADDQAETMLMRLARRAGVDGLSGMSANRIQYGVSWHRPLLGIGRSDLRNYLTARDISWVDDPSNDDTAYDRIKARKALEVLADLDIDAAGLSAVADNMRLARRALNWQSFQLMREVGCTDAGSVVLCARRMRPQPDEIQRRLLMQSIRWVSGNTYPPRRAALLDLVQGLQEGRAGTVDGCHAAVVRGQIWVFREYQAVRDTVCRLGQLWDGRWRVSTTEPTALPPGDLELRALGPEGLKQCPDWRETGRPMESLLGTPAVWQGDTVIAAPVAGFGQNWYADIEGGEDSFFAVLLSH